GGSLDVVVRHPDDPFNWGYWTGTSATHPTETRHVKPFWQTLAHEICGHGAIFARSAGASVGARGSSTGHNDAIIGENQVAAEHGVISDEQRGLDINPATGAPMPAHRGESFLQAEISGFAHGSDVAPATTAGVVSAVVNTIQTTASGTGLDLMIQVEGRAFGNEGGATLAARRTASITSRIRASLRAAGISLTVGSGPRFYPDQTTVVPGTSTSGSVNPARMVLVYLFHKAHSAGP
ncbi:MAG: hypothetical protein JNM19_15715, partial [Chitinophagaceae bacterium]|nr:hypothetical protein [Chitinophagaceae bacterium]